MDWKWSFNTIWSIKRKNEALKNYHGIFLKTVNDESNLDYIYNKIKK